MNLGIFSSYWSSTNAPFVALHLVVSLYATYELWMFWRWDPRPDEEVWQQLETRAQLLRGVIGLLLLIGIAGTFFGLFSLASVEGNFQTRFGDAIRTAFPIGFVGLLLTLVFNTVADILEKQKGARVDRIKRHSSQHFEVMVKLLQEIRNEARESYQALASLPGAVATALRPVEHLGVTLESALHPAITSLDKQLGRMGEVLAHQSRELIEGKDAMVRASDEMRAAALEAAGAIKSIARATSTAVEALEQSKALQREAGALVDSARQTLEAVGSTAGEGLRNAAATLDISSQRLQTATDTIQALPETLSASFTASLSSSVGPIVMTTQEGLRDLTQKTSDALNAHAAALETRLAALALSLQKTTESVSGAVLQQREALASVLEPAGSLFDTVRQRIVDAGNASAQSLRSTAEEHAEGLRELRSSAEITHGRLVTSVQGLEDAIHGLRNVVTAVAPAEGWAAPLAEPLRDSQRATQSLQYAVAQLGDRLDALARELAAVKSGMAELGASLRGARSRRESDSPSLGTAESRAPQRGGGVRALGSGLLDRLRRLIGRR